MEFQYQVHQYSIRLVHAYSNRKPYLYMYINSYCMLLRSEWKKSSEPMYITGHTWSLVTVRRNQEFWVDRFLTCSMWNATAIRRYWLDVCIYIYVLNPKYCCACSHCCYPERASGESVSRGSRRGLISSSAPSLVAGTSNYESVPSSLYTMPMPMPIPPVNVHSTTAIAAASDRGTAWKTNSSHALVVKHAVQWIDVECQSNRYSSRCHSTHRARRAHGLALFPDRRYHNHERSVRTPGGLEMHISGWQRSDFARHEAPGCGGMHHF
jgi:hypothetical protein